MQFITALFGDSAGTLLNMVFALGIVLVLIVLGVWVLKLFTRAGEKLGRPQRRLTVVDSAAVDGKRKVLIIRRDNVEHVILTGGPQDLVIESGIAVADATPQRPAQPAPAAKPAAADIETPIAPERPVTRDTVDRLDDLVRPAPLKPRASLRHTNLLRPVVKPDNDIIPIGPSLRLDKSAALRDDSAKSEVESASVQAGLGGRNRFFRRHPR